MAHSLSQEAELKCPQCGKSFQAEVWLIVDTAERPDLLERIRAGTLHTRPCPHCGHEGMVDAPLLLYRPGETPPLLFSPAQGTTAEQDQEQAAGLVGQLRERLGGAWREEWLIQGLPGVPRQLLAAALEQGLDEALQQAQGQARQAQEQAVAARQSLDGLPPAERARAILEQMVTGTPIALQPDDLDDTLIQVLAQMQTEAPTDSERAAALARLEEWLRGARRQAEAGDSELSAWHRLLMAAGELGQAWIDFNNAPSWEQRRRALQTYPELLGVEADDLLRRLFEAACQEGDSSFAQVFAGHRALFQDCRELGVDVAWARVIRSAGAKPEVPMQFRDDWRKVQETVQHYLDDNDQSALDEAIMSWQRILHHHSFSAAPEHFRLSVFSNAGKTSWWLYESQSRPADLDQALMLWRAAVALTLPNFPHRPALLNDLGLGLRARYTRKWALPDLEEALQAFREVISLTPPDSPDRPEYLNNLGLVLRDCYIHKGTLPDLEEALQAFRAALSIIPLDAPDRPNLLGNLGLALRDRYACKGILSDLEEALQAFRTALENTSSDAPYWPKALNNLALGLRAHYTAIGNSSDLGEALQIYRQSLDLTPTDDPARPTLLNNLGNGLCDYYALTGDLAKLEEALQTFRDAADCTSPDSPYRSGYLSNLGCGLSTRYARIGIFSDLEEALQVFRAALDIVPLGAPERAALLNNLGNGLRDRYTRIGNLTDLEEALQAFREALEHTPPDAAHRPMYLNNLAHGLRDRYIRTKDLADSEESLRVSHQALDLSPPDAPSRPGYLNSLGNGLRDRYAHTRDLADLRAALRAYREALDHTPPNAPGRPDYLSNCGLTLLDHYMHTENLADLEEALQAFRMALDIVSSNAPHRPGYLCNLARGLRDRYVCMKDLADLEEASVCYREACQVGLESHLEATLIAARAWGNWARERQSWPEAAEAYTHGLEAAERLFRVQLRRTSKETWLHEARGLPACAAYALARLGRPNEAVVALERGRARFLSEALARDRADLGALAGARPELAEAYRRAADRVAYLESGEFRPLVLPEGFDLTGEIRRARAALDESIACIRQIPGYVHFLAEPELRNITATAQPDCPLIYLAVTELGGLALVVHTEEVKTIWLAELTEQALREQALGTTDVVSSGYLSAYLHWRRCHHDGTAVQAWFAALDQTTHWLWDVLVEPLLEALHPLNSVQAIFVPQGILGLFPLHAAWTEDGTQPTGRHYALDEITFSYAPNARALAAVQEVAVRVAPDGLLAVDEPQPVTASPLSSSAWEVAAAADHFNSRQVLKGAEATAARLRELLPNYPALHFSCHGAANLGAPLESSLLLANDEIFTLRDLLTLRLPGARLAVLSACETGIPGAELPDEVVSLPAGLLQAGVAGVVGSLWSVADLSTAMLMACFYDLWKGAGLEPAEALRQAQVWLRDTTNAEKAAYFQRDVPRPAGTRMPAAVAAELYGQTATRNPEGRDFAHPFYWAAFYLTGV